MQIFFPTSNDCPSSLIHSKLSLTEALINFGMQNYKCLTRNWKLLIRMQLTLETRRVEMSRSESRWVAMRCLEMRWNSTRWKAAVCPDTLCKLFFQGCHCSIIVVCGLWQLIYALSLLAMATRRQCPRQCHVVISHFGSLLLLRVFALTE